MTRMDLFKFIRRKPFEPFRICMQDGCSYEVRHPRLALVFNAYVRVGLQHRPDPRPIADETIQCWYDQVLRIEPSQPPGTTL